MAATIALIAHDGKKDAMVNFAKKHRPLLNRYRLIATQTTAERLQLEIDQPIEQMLSGTMGGDFQIAAKVIEGEISAVIFLVDLLATPSEPGLQALQRACILHDVPLALNLSTAEAIADSLRLARIAHLIFNPVSGQGNAEEDLKIIKQQLEPAMTLRVHFTTLEIGPEQLTQKAMEARADLIIASGGDGTVSAVADALIGTDVPLGIIPRGTANAFAVALGIPSRLTPIRSACQVILNGNTRKVDAARCNGLPMILLAGIGFEAEMVEKADREAKNRWGALAYIMAGFQQFNEQELFETEIEVEGVVKKFHAAAVTIANAAPPSSVMAQGAGEAIAHDGLLDVTIVAPKTDLQAISALANLVGAALLKTPTNREEIISLQTKRVKVMTNPPQKVVLDGENIGTTPVEIECVPGGLTTIAPPAKNNPNRETGNELPELGK
ncbi:methylglyoxal synthase [Oscillatoriales cyanobacterium LEGE 11467]|uniref:Methylglyoxal synthase n=2 Tax=Zarconia TaxID=2992130 RepID=A0A928Z896_9CYAN|nr:methylglyoxal synthase [Zarconia navalis LEGE 11467]